MPTVIRGKVQRGYKTQTKIYSSAFEPMRCKEKLCEYRVRHYSIKKANYVCELTLVSTRIMKICPLETNSN